MADKWAIHAYEKECERHHAAAFRYLQDVAQASARLVERWDTMSAVLIAGELERIAKDAATAHVRAAQYDTLREVEYLTTDPAPAEEG